MHDLAPLIFDLAVMLGMAGIAIVICQRIHQPVVLGYLVAGMIVGPYTPPYGLIKDIPNIQVLSILGVIFLMFTLGLEFSFRKLIHVGLPAFVIGTIEVVLMILIGYGAGQIMGWTYYDSLFLGAALSISSTTIIIKAIDELHLVHKRFAQLIFGVLIVEDLLAILLLVALSTVVTTNHVLSVNMFYATLKLVMVVGGWFILGYFLVPSLFRRIARYVNQETLTIIAVALCLLLVCIAAKLHYSAALGAFIMGSILAETLLVHRISNLMRPIRDIFGALFFISVGMLIDPRVIIEHWPTVLIITLVTIVGKILTTSSAAILAGRSLNTSVRVGFSMAQVGEFSFIIVALGVALNATSHKLYPMVVAVSGLTTFTTPYLIRVSERFVIQLEKILSDRTKNLLKYYSSWVRHLKGSTKSHNIVFNKSFIRLFLNGILVALIFTLVDNLIYPEITVFGQDSWIANIVCLLVSVILSAPFIWGMVFSYKPHENKLGETTVASPAILISWLIAFIEICLLSIIYFHTWATIILFMVISVIFFNFEYRLLGKYYQWLEKQLVDNIQLEETEQEEPEPSRQVENLVVKKALIGEYHSFVGKSIADSGIMEKVNGYVVAIERSNARELNPDPKTIFQANDIIYIAGDVEKIHHLDLVMLD